MADQGNRPAVEESDAHPEDTTDAKHTDSPDARFNLNPFAPGPERGAGGGEAPMEVEKEEHMYVYNMDHPQRGMAVIINNKTFKASTGMGERNGTDADAANIYQRFKSLGFDVHLFKDQTVREMIRITNDAGKYDHSKSDTFALVVLSHGDEGVIYGTDSIVSVDKLIEPFKGDRCPDLIGKPKLFFFQACRGNKLDHGSEVADAEPDGVQRIPTEADILIAYSVVPGYFSWRNSSKGSWFIQALCKVLEEFGEKKDILWILTRVNRTVAYEFQSNASKEYMNRKKQIPSIESRLTKELYFKPKN